MKVQYDENTLKPKKYYSLLKGGGVGVPSATPRSLLHSLIVLC